MASRLFAGQFHIAIITGRSHRRPRKRRLFLRTALEPRSEVRKPRVLLGAGRVRHLLFCPQDRPGADRFGSCHGGRNQCRDRVHPILSFRVGTATRLPSWERYISWLLPLPGPIVWAIGFALCVRYLHRFIKLEIVAFLQRRVESLHASQRQCVRAGAGMAPPKPLGPVCRPIGTPGSRDKIIWQGFATGGYR